MANGFIRVLLAAIFFVLIMMSAAPNVRAQLDDEASVDEYADAEVNVNDRK
ncbi:hypothetical protein MKW94_022541 [Papaver nudicaule]|uniref:Uncharacterized protein n=1 Tax=Papaver nudicaule TaxID=74823 RepID=A0AA41V990_PAPNU|nr:hypothetical protein [Papaver nudicaule]